MAGPRLLAIMGSGETAPTMARVHRMLLDRLEPPVRAVLLDTPYGFQVNAEQLSARTVGYFDTTVRAPLRVATWRTTDSDALTRERALDLVRGAEYVFAGPGSPTYALRVWQGSPLREVLAAKLADGGCVSFASAAALTLGLLAVPVYEVYKVGAAPHWVPGLDLLSTIGLRVAVIPHYDNAEGGNHDTRFSYLGEHRLRMLETLLDNDTAVLGVDEHTACVLDLDADTATVLGRGQLTLRRLGTSIRFPAGAMLRLDELRAIAAGRAAPATAPPVLVPAAQPSLRATTAQLRGVFDTSLEVGDVPAAVRAALDLEQAIADWSADPEEEDGPDGPRAELRRMLLRLGELAEAGARDPAELVAPFVRAMIELRDQAREQRSWAVADTIRERLLTAGVDVRDTHGGTTWSLLP